MKRMQFSVLTMFLAVTFTGVGCAALVNASPLWTSIALSSTVLLLLAATLAAVYARSRMRTFAGGFAIAGWAYLLLAMGNVFEVESFLVTVAANNALYGAMHESPPVYYAGGYGYSGPYTAYQPIPVATTTAVSFTVPSDPAQTATALPAPAPVYSYVQTIPAMPANFVDPGAFNRIGHSLWAILLGVLGGVAATWLAGASDRRETPAGA